VAFILIFKADLKVTGDEFSNPFKAVLEYRKGCLLDFENVKEMIVTLL
jgi:hypothetical protein